MKITKLEKYFRGWFIGNFEPTCYKTEDFEVGLLTHKKGEFWAPHIHKISTEINLLVEGEMIMNDEKINKGDIFIIEPNEIATPIFLTDCKVLVIKTPSLPGDKYNI
jgi:mannose-6-phosphate isomerase-like protein (cupin superfamily)